MIQKLTIALKVLNNKKFVPGGAQFLVQVKEKYGKGKYHLCLSW